MRNLLAFCGLVGLFAIVAMQPKAIPAPAAQPERAPRALRTESTVAGARVLGIKRLSERETLTELLIPERGLPGRGDRGTVCYLYTREDLAVVKVICPSPFQTSTD